jgi:hypothetical protein
MEKSNELVDKIKHPEKYFKVVSSYPPKPSGNLLCWLLHFFRKENYDATSVDHIEMYDGKFFKFNVEDFDREMTSLRGAIEDLYHVFRFVMEDGSMFEVEPCDGEYHSTQLHFIPRLEGGERIHKSGIQKYFNRN